MVMMKAMVMQNANLALRINCMFADLLALRTAAEFSQRQQFSKTAVIDTFFLTDRMKT